MSSLLFAFGFAVCRLSFITNWNKKLVFFFVTFQKKNIIHGECWVCAWRLVKSGLFWIFYFSIIPMHQHWITYSQCLTSYVFLPFVVSTRTQSNIKTLTEIGFPCCYTSCTVFLLLLPNAIPFTFFLDTFLLLCRWYSEMSFSD